MHKFFNQIILIILIVLFTSTNSVLVSQCNVSLGNDTVYCGIPFNLDAGSGYETYEWQNGSTASVYTVNSVGTYSVEVATTGSNIVTNGDFELGNISFICGYNYATNLWPEGTYWVGPNATTVHANFIGIDHTPAPGVNFLIVNGAALPGTNVWAQTINVTPNTDYKFSTWVCSVTPSSPAQLQFSINTTMIGAVFFAPPAVNQWLQFYIIWNSGANVTADISIVNQNVAGSGNDFGIDDISFRPIILCSDTINVVPSDLSSSISGININCNGEETGSANSNITGGYQPYSYLWSNNSVIQNINNVGAGFYTLTVTDASNCTTTADITLIEPATPVIGSLVSSSINCFGGNDGSINLTPGGGTGPYTFHWNTGSVSEDLSGLISNNYTVTITDSNGCQKSESVFVDQPDLLSVVLQGNSLSCYGDTNAFTQTIVSGGVLDYTYSWSTGANTLGITNLGAGTYSVTVTDLNGCIASADIIFEEPDPIVLYSSGDQSICLGQSANIVTNSVGGILPYTYFWDPGGYGTPSITVYPYTSTQYSVYISDANGCESNIRNISVFVAPPLDLEISVNKDTICLGDTIIISSNVSGGDGGPYFLELFQGPIIDMEQIFIPETSRKYIIVAYDGCGTPNVADTVYVYVAPSPMVSFGSDRISGCQPLTIQFGQNILEENCSYFWDFEDGQYFDNSITANPTHTFLNPGLYDISLNVTNKSGCTKEVKIDDMITVFAKPTSIFQVEPQTASIIHPVINYYNYSENTINSFWIFGDGDSLWIDQPPQHYFPDVGSYLTSLITVSAKGCIDTSYQWVEITDISTFYVPSAFNPYSPSETNRIFRPFYKNIDPDNYRLYIYNRWGEMIFSTESLTDGWDGKTSDINIAKSGNYTWKIIFSDFSGNRFSKTGNVFLLY